MPRTLLPLLASVIAALLTACVTQPDYRAVETPPQTVKHVDLERYAGRWYEIARYPNSFETGCEGVTADYALRNDGRVTVTNTCREGRVDGPSRVAEGVARVVNAANTQLKVKFAPWWVPFAEGAYWVLHLEPDYSAALVGDPDGRYLWILARTPSIDGATRQRIEHTAKTQGYQTAPLRETLQPPK